MTNQPATPTVQRRDPARAGRGCRDLVARGTLVAMVLAGGALASRRVGACSAPNPADAPLPTALPRNGASEVPTATSFVIVSTTEPADIAIESGGVAVSISPAVAIGGGQDDATGFPVAFWQVKPAAGVLPGSADITLSVADGKGGRITLTTIHTAAGYDKQQGTPSTLRSLTLTRVRYPLSEINSGDCVFSEYIGFIAFESDAATIPGTPADSIVNTIVLTPKNGGAASQARAYTGARSYSGTPTGSVTHGAWFPYLDPTLEYCAGITSFGYGDIARLSLASNTLCAHVTEVDAPGFRQSDGGAADGTTTAGDLPELGDSDGGVTDGATTVDDGGEGRDASVDTGAASDRVQSGSGCAVGGGGRKRPAALALIAVAWFMATIASLRRRGG